MPKINKKSSLQCVIYKKDLFKSNSMYVLSVAMHEDIKKTCLLSFAGYFVQTG